MQELLASIPALLQLLQQVLVLYFRSGPDRKSVMAAASSTLTHLKTGKNPAESAKKIQELFKKLNVLLLALLLSACGVLPPRTRELRVTVCVSDPPMNGFQCSTPEGSSTLVPYSESGNFLAFSSDDAFSIIDRLIDCKLPDTVAPKLP